MRKRKHPQITTQVSSYYQTVFYDVILEAIHLFILKGIKENLSWVEIIKTFYYFFDIPEVFSWDEVKSLLKADAKFYAKISKRKYRKFLIPADLKDLLIETRALYLYLLTLFPKPFARILAYDYAFFHPSFQKYPFFVTTSLIADALSVRRRFYEYTPLRLKKAFEKLKTVGPLRGVDIDFEDLFRVEIEENKRVSQNPQNQELLDRYDNTAKL